MAIGWGRVQDLVRRTAHHPSLPARAAWRTSFSRTDWLRGSEERQASREGFRPRERRVETLCWVGLVFCSPTAPITGTRLTCTTQKFPGGE